MIVNAAAFAVLLTRGRAVAVAAWWWLGFLAVLGPIALARIDSITVPIALAGMLLLATRPRIAAVLLTIAAWIKVWPAALVAAASRHPPLSAHDRSPRLSSPRGSSSSRRSSSAARATC